MTSVGVYGASGFTGKLAAADLVRRGIEPVLVGRSDDRLRAAARELGAADAERRIASSDRPDSLARAFAELDVVINCAGPFTPTGAIAARAAMRAGCHYVDVAGEQHYLQAMFDALDDEAKHRGIAVVPGLNNNGAPADLLAHLVAARLREVERIVIAHDQVSAGPPSRGTIKSVLATIDAIRGGGLGFQDGGWVVDAPARTTTLTFPGATIPDRVVRYPQPAVVTVPRHLRASTVEGVVKESLHARLSAVTADSLAQAPDEVSPTQRAHSQWTLVVEAIAHDGSRARGIATGSDGYGTTAAIAVEAALRLVHIEAPRAGVLAPAQAFDADDFMRFLETHGVQLALETTR